MRCKNVKLWQLMAGRTNFVPRGEGANLMGDIVAAAMLGRWKGNFLVKSRYKMLHAVLQRGKVIPPSHSEGELQLESLAGGVFFL